MVSKSSLFIVLIAASCLTNAPHSKAAIDYGDNEWHYVEQASAEPQGGIIIRYPDVIEARARKLSEQLSRHGWSSLLVPVELSNVMAAPAQNTHELIDLMSSQKGQLNLVLLTFGNASDTSTSIDVLSELNVPIQGAVFVDVPGSVASVPGLPTLDIATTVPAVQGFKERQTMARRDKISSNTSLSLNYSTRSRTDKGRDDRLTRRIRGWLYHNLRGMEVSEPDQ